MTQPRRDQHWLAGPLRVESSEGPIVATSVRAAARSRQSNHIRRPSPRDRSSVRPETMLRAQSLSTATHSSGAKNTGSVIAMQPISGRARDPARLSPETIQADQQIVLVPGPVGLAEDVPRAPHRKALRPCEETEAADRIVLALQLEEDGAPGAIALNAHAARTPEVHLGDVGRARKNWYQPWSVGATKPSTFQSSPGRDSDARREGCRSRRRPVISDGRRKSARRWRSVRG